MNDNIFIDTNIFVYAHVLGEEEKHEKVHKLFNEALAGVNVVVSTQVLNEFYSAMSKYKCTHDDILLFMADIIKKANVASVSLSTVEKCLSLKKTYGYSYWDSLILSSALENECGAVYSEDMQHNKTIDGKLTIINPFLQA